MQAVIWDPALISKYNINGPRYTSYPTALALSPDFPKQRELDALQSGKDVLSLYLHIPFCHQLCYYCGCNKLVTRHQHKADQYLQALAQEIALYQPYLSGKSINQIHLGGGTPTFLTEEQLTQLWQLLQQNFSILPDAEISIEIDPRSCSVEKLAHLRQLGFNRVSYGVQDFDQQVQIAINRLQDAELVRSLVTASRELGFQSVNLDLVYGLPYQKAEVFQDTLAQVIALDPDRISLFSYAHLPERFAAQRKIPDSSLPAPAEKLHLLQLAIAALTKAGYQFIGMDHFAKPTDALARAQQQGKLQRNFQGYTTAGQDALLGLGVSAISQVNGVIWQNAKELNAYYAALTATKSPVDRGVLLTDDDKLRAALISQLICHFTLDIQQFSQQWQLTQFWHYFADALPKLQPFIEDGLVEKTDNRLTVTAKGRLWVRSICACFDAYLQQGQQRYSKVV